MRVQEVEGHSTAFDQPFQAHPIAGLFPCSSLRSEP